MSANASVAPRLLLGTESLLGVSSATRDRTLQVAARFAEPESLAVTFSEAYALAIVDFLPAMIPGALDVVRELQSRGYRLGLISNTGRTPGYALRAILDRLGLRFDAMVFSNEHGECKPQRSIFEALRQALEELKGAIPVYALLPNVPEYVRDSSELGLFGAARKRFSQARLAAQLRLVLTGMARAAGVLASDFAALVPLLLELEAAGLGSRDLRGIVLAAPLTDLALAGRHRRFFERYCRFVRDRFRAAAAFETRNLGHLIAALDEWGITPDFVIGPVNPKGLLMKPSPAELLEALRRTSLTVLAQELRAGGRVTLVEGARFAIQAGARGLVPDLVDLDEASELKELSALLGPAPGTPAARA